jgi:hypothetical protein
VDAPAAAAEEPAAKTAKTDATEAPAAAEAAAEEAPLKSAPMDADAPPRGTPTPVLAATTAA